MTPFSEKRCVRKISNTQGIYIYPAPVAYQFSDAVVGKNELRQAGQSLLQVFPYPTAEGQKPDVYLRPGVSGGEKMHRNMLPQQTAHSDTGRGLR